jgi:hypothetical protein
MMKKVMIMLLYDPHAKVVFTIADLSSSVIHMSPNIQSHWSDPQAE